MAMNEYNNRKFKNNYDPSFLFYSLLYADDVIFLGNYRNYQKYVNIEN